MQHMSNVQMVHVPYKGTPSLIIDLLSGQIQLGVMSVNLVVPHVKSGRMRAIAVTSKQRTGLLPDVPTVDEAGLKGYDVTGWYGLVAPAKTPGTMITALNKAFAQSLDHPEAKAVIAREGARPGGESPEHFSQFLSSERDAYKKLIDEANLRKE
jgi:tripartite-type tricarboxylate transporter receptor subunit TctC